MLHISALSKFLSVKRDVNFSTRKSVGRTYLTFCTRYDELKKENIFLKKIFCHGVDLFCTRPSGW